MIHRSKPEFSDAASRARWIYWGSGAVSHLSLLVATTYGLDWLGPSHYGGLAVVPCLLLSKCVAAWACRRAGVSQEGRWREVIERNSAAALAPFLSEAPDFEIKRALSGPTTVNREGIAHGELSARWDDVGSCLWSTRRGVLGELAMGNLLLLGHGKTPVFQCSPGEQDAKKLLAAIRFYLRAESPEDTSAST